MTPRQELPEMMATPIAVAPAQRMLALNTAAAQQLEAAAEKARQAVEGLGAALAALKDTMAEEKGDD